MRSNPSILAALTLLASATLGPIAAPVVRVASDEKRSRRSVVRARRDIVHITVPEPLGKRAKRRARARAKARR